MDGALVPVVIVHGVGPQQAVGSVLGVAVWLRLDKGDWTDLPCDASLQCRPTADTVIPLARALPTAALMRLRLDVTLPNGTGLPQPEHEFDLHETRRALERLQAAGPVTATSPAASGLDWRGMMQKFLKRGGG